MKNISISILVLSLSFSLYCSDNKVDKSAISDAEQLNSPNGQFTLYRYFVNSSMSFGSGFTAIDILSSNNKFYYSDKDIFRLDNDSPFFIKWKNNDTLMVKCIIDGGELSDKQPVKSAIKKWKDWTFEVEYYSMYSTTAEVKVSFDSYSIDNNFMTFKSNKNSLVFKKNEVQISLDAKHIYLTQFKIDTFKLKTGISFSHYDLTTKGSYKQSDFLEQQAFVKTIP